MHAGTLIFKGIADVGAVAVNVTAVKPAAPGFVTIYPFGSNQPMASNLNFEAGQTVDTRTASPDHDGQLAGGGKVAAESIVTRRC